MSFPLHPVKGHLYECRILIQYEKPIAEVTYLEEVYHTVYQRFLSAIDHLEYHPRVNSTTHKKGSIHKPYIPFHQCDDLSPAEELFLDKLMHALDKLNPNLYEKLSHQKRFMLMTWKLGWGVYLNARNIWWIKEYIHILQEQKELQENQILELAQFLNLTMVQVAAHQNMLCELDTKILIMPKPLVKTLRAVTYLICMIAIFTDIQTSLNQLTLGI